MGEVGGWGALSYGKQVVQCQLARGDCIIANGISRVKLAMNI